MYQFIANGDAVRALGVSSVLRAKAVVTLPVLNAIIMFLLGSACVFAVSSRLSLLFLFVYLVVTTHRVGSILPSVADPSKRPLQFDDCALVVRRSRTSTNDLSVEFRTPNGKTAESRDLPVTLRRETVHPLLCPVLWFLMLAHRAGAMNDWEHTDPELLDADVLDGKATNELRLPFKGGAVCWTTRPMTVTGAGEFLREISACLRFSIPVRIHSLRTSGALKLKWLGKSACLTQ